MNLKQFFNSKGYDITEKINWDIYLNLWENWYKGKVKNFHSYYIYNGQKRVKKEKKSLQGAKKVCEDWADLLFNEKVKINLGTENDTEALENIIKENNGVVLINRGVEKGFELGIGALVVSVQDMIINKELNTIDVTNSKIKFEFVEGKKIYPLSWENGEIKECAFVTYKTEKGINYVYISMHIINNKGNYEIQNYKFKGTNDKMSLVPIDNEDGFVDIFDTRKNIPWFSILKPNICNNIEYDTPFGISIYANAIDILKSLDNAYNELDNEVILGRRRTFISEEVMTYDSGTETLTFDPEDISIYRMPKGFQKDSMIQNSSDELRTDRLQSAVQFQLNMLSSKVGFGQNRYKFDGSNIQTATGVISENSDMYRTMRKHEQVLENSLRVLIKAIAYASSTFSNTSINADEITITFDDSIIEDKGAEQIRAQSEVGAGLRSKLDYLENIRGLGSEEAKKELQEIEDEKMNNQDVFGMIPTEE